MSSPLDVARMEAEVQRLQRDFNLPVPGSGPGLVTDGLDNRTFSSLITDSALHLDQSYNSLLAEAQHIGQGHEREAYWGRQPSQTRDQESRYFDSGASFRSPSVAGPRFPHAADPLTSLRSASSEARGVDGGSSMSSSTPLQGQRYFQRVTGYDMPANYSNGNSLHTSRTAELEELNHSFKSWSNQQADHAIEHSFADSKGTHTSALLPSQAVLANGINAFLSNTSTHTGDPAVRLRNTVEEPARDYGSSVSQVKVESAFQSPSRREQHGVANNVSVSVPFEAKRLNRETYSHLISTSPPAAATSQAAVSALKSLQDRIRRLDSEKLSLQEDLLLSERTRQQDRSTNQKRIDVLFSQYTDEKRQLLLDMDHVRHELRLAKSETDQISTQCESLKHEIALVKETARSSEAARHDAVQELDTLKRQITVLNEELTRSKAACDSCETRLSAEAHAVQEQTVRNRELSSELGHMVEEHSKTLESLAAAQAFIDNLMRINESLVNRLSVLGMQDVAAIASQVESPATKAAKNKNLVSQRSLPVGKRASTAKVEHEPVLESASDEPLWSAAQRHTKSYAEFRKEPKSIQKSNQSVPSRQTRSSSAERTSIDPSLSGKQSLFNNQIIRTSTRPSSGGLLRSTTPQRIKVEPVNSLSVVLKSLEQEISDYSKEYETLVAESYNLRLEENSHGLTQRLNGLVDRIASKVAQVQLLRKHDEVATLAALAKTRKAWR
eukprot:GILK01010409.1.p1 GENE.GILK01010409.1~~GILK01010409.1.p1  ORF type:complete len:740 (-),score=146.33 GILK01010409.1:192-2369(-)